MSPDGTQLYVTNDSLDRLTHRQRSDEERVAPNVPQGPCWRRSNRGCDQSLPGTHVFVGRPRRNRFGDRHDINRLRGADTAVCGCDRPPPIGDVRLRGVRDRRSGASCADLDDGRVRSGGSGQSGGGTYDAGTVVALTATPAVGSQFSGWSGDCSGSSNPCNVTMDAGKSVTATFTQLHHVLTVTSSPAAGGSITPAGGTYAPGTVVTLTVTPNAGYQFSGWSGACSGTNACNVTMDAAKSVTANFTLLQYVLAVTSSPPAGGSVTPAGGTYTYGTVVTLTVTPNAGYQFSGWSGACSGTNACNVTMDAAKSVTANFTLLQYALTVTSSPAAGGSVNPAGGTYAHGTVVTLTATPAAGYQYSGWWGCSASADTCSVTMDGPKSVTALFTVTSPPTTCDDKIKDLQKKVAADKHPWRHDHQLKAALRLYSAAQDELAKAKAKVGEKDKRYVRALKEFNNGKAALCAGHYRRAHHELWESYDIAHEILKHSHRR